MTNGVNDTLSEAPKEDKLGVKQENKQTESCGSFERSDKKTNIKQKVKEVPQNWATGVHDSLDIMPLPVVKNAQEIDSNLIFTTPALQSVNFFYMLYTYIRKSQS